MAVKERCSIREGCRNKPYLRTATNHAGERWLCRRHWVEWRDAALSTLFGPDWRLVLNYKNALDNKEWP